MKTKFDSKLLYNFSLFCITFYVDFGIIGQMWNLYECKVCWV